MRDSVVHRSVDTSVAGQPETRGLAQYVPVRFRRLSVELFWIGLGQTAAVLGALVGIRILTSVLSQEAYGELALGMTAATLVNLTVLGPLSNAATRFFAPAREAGALQGYLAVIRSLTCKASGVVAVSALLLCFGLWGTGQSRWISLALAAMFFGLVSGYNSLLNGMQNAARQRAIVALHQGVASWGRFLLAAALVLWLGSRSDVAMVGYVGMTLLVLASQRWFFRRTVSGEDMRSQVTGPSSTRWKDEVLAYGWPFAVWGIPAWAHFSSDRWALQVFRSTEEVGLYAVLYQLGYYPITILTSLMTQLLAPVYFQRAGNGGDQGRVQGVHVINWRLTWVVLAFTLAAALGAAFFHRIIFLMLVAPAYRSISWMLPGLILCGGLYAAGQVVSLSLHAGVQTRRLIAPQVGVAVVGAAVNFMAARFFGIQGVVAGGVLVSTGYLIWVICLVSAGNRLA